MFLSANALDGNNRLFPIAYGVVESEGRDSWSFFLQNLHTAIGGNATQSPWCFMSDMQKVNFILYFYIYFHGNSILTTQLLDVITDWIWPLGKFSQLQVIIGVHDICLTIFEVSFQGYY